MLCWTFHTSRANTWLVALSLTGGRCQCPFWHHKRLISRIFRLSEKWSNRRKGCMSVAGWQKHTWKHKYALWSDSLNCFKFRGRTLLIGGLLFAVLRFLHKQRGLRLLHRPAVQTVNIPAKSQNNIGGKALQSESLALFSWQATWGMSIVPSFIYGGQSLFWQTVCLWN